MHLDSEMKTIAFFSIPAYGHIRPTLPVVEELVQRGCRVIYFIDETHRDAVAATGCEVRVVPNYTGMPQVVPKTGTGIAAVLTEQAYRTLPMLLEQVAKEDIGVIVHDSFCIWGMCVALLTNIPSVRSCSVLMGAAPPLPDHSALSALWSFLREEFTVSDWLHFRKFRRKLIRERNVPPPLRLGFTTADRTLVFTSKELMPTSDQLDERTQFIGSSFSNTGAPTDFNVPDPGDRPLIYISIGTTFTNEPGFFESCKRAFGSTDALVVMSLGRHVDPKSLEPWPENFTVGPYLPQLDVLRKASVFVMQAGGCSVMEGLWHGVPLVMVPLINEHWYNVKLVEPTGAGVLLKKEDVTAERLRDTALAVHADPRYREAAVRMGDTFRAAGGPPRGADVILDFCPEARPAET